MSDLFYSFGTSNPGAIVLHNYPNHFREFTRPDKVTIDLASYDILRTAERGVPRYNDFRRKFHLKPAATFETASDARPWPTCAASTAIPKPSTSWSVCTPRPRPRDSRSATPRSGSSS